MVAVTVLIGGCRGDAFSRGPMPKLQAVDLNALPAHVAFQTPQKFSSQDTLIVQIPFKHDLAGIGAIDVDRASGTFEFVGLTSTGVEVLHVAYANGQPIIRSAVGPLMKHKAILESLARDLAAAFLDPQPASGADVDKGSVSVSYTDPDGTVREFGGSPIELLNKSTKTTTIAYYDYLVGDEGYRHPRNISIDDSHYKVRIILMNQEWSLSKEFTSIDR